MGQGHISSSRKSTLGDAEQKAELDCQEQENQHPSTICDPYGFRLEGDHNRVTLGRALAKRRAAVL